MTSDGYPSISQKEIIVGITLLISCVIVFWLFIWTKKIDDSIKVKNASSRFEIVFQPSWIAEHQFIVFHDKISGQEIICVEPDHSCFPSGRNWK